MMLNYFLESIECANSHSFKHVVEKPIAIKCGHSICKSCITHFKEEFSCFHCKKSFKLDTNLQEMDENVAAKYIIESSLKDLFSLLEERFKFILEDFKSFSIKTVIQSKIDLIRDEIQLRVESIKHELDIMFETFDKDLEEMKNKIFKIAEIDEKIIKRKINKCKEIIQDLNSNRDILSCNTKTHFYDYQDKLKKMDDKHRTLIRDKLKVNFDVSELKIEPTLIGYLQYSLSNLPNSNILDTEEFNTLKLLCQFSSDTKWSLAYRASTDGYTAKAFHTICDNLCDTFSLIKTTNGFIFGGFTKRKWNSVDDSYLLEDSEAFVISFKNYKNRKFKKMNIYDIGINSNPDYGPCFGKRSFYFFYIQDNFNNNLSYFNPIITENAEETKLIVQELEVFSINFIE